MSPTAQSFSSELISCSSKLSFHLHSLFSSSLSMSPLSLSPSLYSHSSFSLSLSNLGLGKESQVDLDEKVDLSTHIFLLFAFFALLVGGFKRFGGGGLTIGRGYDGFLLFLFAGYLVSVSMLLCQ